jgi:SAM-dependent methyltransferase
VAQQVKIVAMTQTSDMQAYRDNPEDVERVARLFTLVPDRGSSALDVGARDGYLSLMLAERFERVVALDLSPPTIEHPRVECVQGDAASLAFPDNAFHTVVCAEVLEHIAPHQLAQVCREIVRVAAHCVVIGVPYRQDLRVARTTCRHCGATNPPWGHANSFDESKLRGLMSGLAPAQIDFVGRTRAATNALSSRLLQFAGNPYGTYHQDEPCLYCEQPLLLPPPRTLTQKIATKLATWGNDVQGLFTPWQSNWIHMRFDKPTAP